MEIEADQGKIWTPAQFLPRDSCDKAFDSPPAYVVVILNVPIRCRDRFINAWRQACFRVCADGGANRLKELGLTSEEAAGCTLDYICGDLDSIEPDVQEYYIQNHGTKIVYDNDQYSTDLDKALNVIKDLANHQNESLEVLICGGLDGRADQAFSQLHKLYAIAAQDLKLIPSVYLMTADSVVFLLHSGYNIIRLPVGHRAFLKQIGIVPLDGPVVVTTAGLEWNLASQELRFGEFISTSNHVAQETISVRAARPILFMASFAGA